jgi:hypothetical protein
MINYYTSLYIEVHARTACPLCARHARAMELELLVEKNNTVEQIFTDCMSLRRNFQEIVGLQMPLKSIHLSQPYF